MARTKIKLRRLQESDIPELARLADNRRIWDNLRDYFPHPYTEDDAKLFIFSKLDENPQQTFGIEYRGRLAGVGGLVRQYDVHRYCCEIGYWIGEEFWGKGIATSVVRSLTEYAFEELAMERLFAAVFAYNQASIRVLQKSGYQLECVSKRGAYKNGKFVDEHRYYLLKSERSLVK